MSTRIWRVSAIAGTIFLAACATPSPQAGRAAVDQLLATRGLNSTADATALEQQVAASLKGPLSVQDALVVALLKSPRVQTAYADLGIARADVIAASRLSNPRFALLRTRESGESGTGLTRSLSLHFTELLWLSTRQRVAKTDYQRVQRQIGAAILEVAVDVELAWFEAVGAEQVSAMRAAVARAAKLSAQLAQRFHEAGNMSRLHLRMHQAAASQAQIDARRASAEASVARTRLASLLGIRSQDQWSLPNQLAAPPKELPSAARLRELAATQRLDVAAAQSELSLRQDSLRLAKGWRWFGDVELGIERETEIDGARVRGLEVSLELPIFQQGQSAIARAQAELDLTKLRQSELQLAIDNDVHAGLERLSALRDVAEEYRANLVPQREDIVADTQKELNFMFTSAFELLLAKQQEYDAYQDYLNAVRDYWMARAELKRAVGGALPDDGAAPTPTLGVEAILPAAKDAEGDKHEHHHH